MAARKQEIDKLQAELDNAQKAVDQTAEEYKLKVTDPVNQAQNDLGDAEDAEKKLTANFDRFAKLAVQKQWGFGDTFRALPILDAFESPTKIRQIVLSDLPIEYGSFKFVTRSCANAKETIKMEDGRDLPLYKLDTSSESHPFYTGTQKSVDNMGGRVERFRNRFGKTVAK